MNFPFQLNRFNIYDFVSFNGTADWISLIIGSERIYILVFALSVFNLSVLRLI